jgi:hypothetical protein
MLRDLSILSLPRRSLLSLGSVAAMTLCGCGAGYKVLTGGSGGGTAAVTAVSNGPQLGYAWNAADETLRPILGVPGSSLVGTSVVPAGAYVAAGTSAASGVALLVGTDLRVYRMTLPSGTPVQVGQAATAASVVRFSPSGTSAVVFVPGATSATVLTGLTGTVTAMPLTASAPLVDAAASDAGSVVGLVKSSGTVSVALLGASGRQIGSVGQAGGISFVGTGEDLLVGDAAGSSLTLIRTASTTPAASVVATSGLLKAPVSVGTSRNGMWAAVANGGDSSVVRVDLTGATAAQRIAAPTQPTVVAQLAGNGTFRFNDVGTGPAWISDVTAATPSMLFIPALAAGK